ncbi:MAG: cytochrome c family protein [Caulobacteraceae bacterium]|nr:cytochrome c family protein [Caulobacteraceae bacterium]
MRSVSAVALFVAISLVTACSKATPPSDAEIEAQANAPATTPTPPPPAPAAAAAPAAATAAAGAPEGKPAAPAVAAVDLANAQSKMIVCKACHNMTQGGPNGLGPNLFGVTTRKAGSQTGYTYSDAFLAANIGQWNEAKLDKWLSGPMTEVPGTKMAFAGVKNDKDRKDIIGFLETLK